MKVLVTGGSGFIGTNLVELLIMRGHSVLNIDSVRPCNKAHHHLWKCVDIMDRKAVIDAFIEFNPDWVVHLAGRADCDENTTVEEGYTANTIGHQNVLDAINATPSIQNAVITSSQYVCGPGHHPKDEFEYAPATVYGQSKVITEKLTYAAELHCTWTIIRPTNIWGPWHARYRREFWKIARKGLYFHPGGDPVIRCYGYVGNLVAHVEKILEAAPGIVHRKVFYLSDPADDIHKWASSFCIALCGKPAPKIPRFLLHAMGVAGDTISSLTGNPFYVNSSRVKSMTSDYLVPGWIENTIATLGPPAYTLNEGVNRTADWFLRDRALTKEKKRIVVAGQIPPPVGGQNIMIRSTLDSLRSNDAWRVEHLPLNFNTSFTKIRAFSLSKIRELVKIYFRLFRLGSEGGMDLLIYPYGGKHRMPMVRDMLLLPACFLVSRKVVVWLHTGGIAEELDSFPSLFRKAYLSVFSRVRAAVVMTDFNKCDPRALGIGEIHVIPHHIEDMAAGEEGRVGQEIVRLLYLGHLYPDKGIPELLDAFDLIADSDATVELDLVGEAIAPWNEEILTNRIAGMRHRDRVKWHGLAQGEEKNRFFRLASVLIFPSVAPGESFGLVLAEGLMWGLPIVATDWRGARDVLTPDFYGRMVGCDPLTGEELANSIRDLMDHREEWPEAWDKNRSIYLERYRETSHFRQLHNFVSGLVGKEAGLSEPSFHVDTVQKDSRERGNPLLSLSVYVADQNAYQGRSFGIMRMTQLILSILSNRDDVYLHVVSSTSSLQSPDPTERTTVLPWSTRSRYVRALTDHIYPLLIWPVAECDVWYFPKGFLPRFKFLCSPSVITIHDAIIQYDEDNYPQWRSRWEYRYWARMLKYTLRNADMILTVSESSKGQILAFMERHRIPAKEIIVTHESCLYETIAQPVNPAKGDYVLHLASCEPHKRTAHLIRWYNDAETAGRTIPALQLVGSVPDACAGLLAASKLIHQRPFLEDSALQEAYSRARAIILPSEIEGFGLPALEAYYLGTPVCFVKGTSVEEILSVATNKGGFNLEDPESLLVALDEVMAMDPSEIRACGLKLRETYATDVVADRMMQAFRNVANG